MSPQGRPVLSCCRCGDKKTDGRWCIYCARCIRDLAAQYAGELQGGQPQEVALAVPATEEGAP